jgi:hypothetical protein
MQVKRSEHGGTRGRNERTAVPVGSARPRRGLVAGTTVALAAVALILIVAPWAQGSGSRALTTLHAPYHGFPYVANSASTFGCGGTAANWKPAAFSTATGAALLGEHAHAVPCGSPASFSVGIASGDAGFFSSAFTATSGVHHVVVHWKVVWGAKLMATPGKGSAFAEDFVAGFAEIYDGTTSTTFHQAHNWSQTNMTFNGTVTFNGSKTVSLYVNATLVTGHTYFVITYIYGTATAYATGTATGGSADAMLNKATLGNSGKLTSITIS